MALISHILASGPGWQVSDVVCTAGPHDRPFEEQHDSVSLAAVTQGTFQYRSTHGVSVLAPGALLLGNAGTCFACGHEHGVGDRCLAFHFTPDHWETIVTGMPGARRTDFALPRLPPSPRLVPVLAAAEAARDDGDAGAFEELAVRLAGVASAALAGTKRRACAHAPSGRDERRVTAALRRIEAAPDAPFALAGLAREAAMSPYHFLRVFRQVVGMTPYQFVLHTRLRSAAKRLWQTADPITLIAIESGFNDLSTFNRRFRRLMGLTPSAYRSRFIA
jgi:AraC family transcriptional regulator